jgi:hypothetical protein
MRRFSGQDSIDPDDPELDYSPLSSSERAAKPGPSASQRARSEPIKVVPLSRPALLAPKAINEPDRRTRDLDRRAALLSVAARFAAVVGAVAVVALLLVIIMKPVLRQSIASSTPSDTTGSTPQSNQGDVKSKPTPPELEALPGSPPTQVTTHEQSQQLLQHFLQWRERALATESSASTAKPQ